MVKHRVVAVVKAKLSALWIAAQVELQGQYSTQRQRHERITSILRVGADATALSNDHDVVQLRPITAGVHANDLFFVRAFVSFWVASVMTYVQFKHIVAEAPLSSAQITISGAVVGGLTAAVMYALALVIGFPLPFSIAVVSPAWLTLLLLPLTSWIKRVYSNHTVWSHVVNSLKVMMCQETLIVVYPAYFYIFTTIPSSGKTAFALLLPVIKLVLRNFMANAVAHLNDDVPEVVILNVEVFSALFVAYCMQNTPSVKTTFVLMAVDALQMSASLYDIGHVIQRMKTFRREIKAAPIEDQQESQIAAELRGSGDPVYFL
ncbi:hypothetical protein PHYSODRAFT_247592 [Phytophthora sojae]|uniref:Uncharacterized protein n=1 Tax=Phytophthora sojae (strain P6497) TaxID=1094619 RepID=G4YK42_PHYSP|nr:hypothetical protein PHYSODRAFT_247592 [Phytophthora sojae]EGZ27805.1 hypothetical protein PHYSODRAFT_247592 [Phytophthora sojae]|eukprot:XP_009515080.1 hypothetical protein PHYSODRAFT_247592 [Phytophthora sojae]